MQLGRRRFLGAVAGTAATVLFPRSAADAVVPSTGTWNPWGTARLPGAAQPATPADVSPASVAPDGTAPFAGAPALLPRALAALDRHSARVVSRDVIGLVDFSAPSRSPRFHLIDLAGGRVLSTHLVAHGKGSDPANSGWAERFSNRIGSEASCEGSFITGPTYAGKHGRSRKLVGVDPGNDRAIERGIVIHAASYVDSALASEQGRIGRSQGCFAVPVDEISHVLERLGPGRLLFAAR